MPVYCMTIVPLMTKMLSAGNQAVSPKKQAKGACIRVCQPRMPSYSILSTLHKLSCISQSSSAWIARANCRPPYMCWLGQCPTFGQGCRCTGIQRANATPLPLGGPQCLPWGKHQVTVGQRCWAYLLGSFVHTTSSPFSFHFTPHRTIFTILLLICCSLPLFILLLYRYS